MPHTVTARSLSSLNAVADEPPLSPPLQLQDEEPLVLYIARVPGRQDVFLTTMKPRDKVVSAHDVESSIYYCHLTADDDQSLLDAGLAEQATLDNGVDGSHTAPISGRENLPFVPFSVIPGQHRYQEWSNSPSAQGEPQTPVPKKLQQIRRKPVNTRNSPLPLETSAVSAFRKRIQGPRPLENKPSQVRSPPIMQQVSGNRLNCDVNRYDGEEENSGASLDDSFKEMSLNRAVSKSGRSITLIRRDPATGEQWDVGIISLQHPGSPCSPSKSPKRRRRNVKIDILTPGYDKFEDDKSTEDGGFSRYLHLSDQSSTSQPGTPFTPTSPSKPVSAFSFTTPWHTSCQLQSTASGRTLKCYHNLPESSFTSTARAIAGPGGRPTHMLVSELRFNLPPSTNMQIQQKKENRRPISYESRSSNRNSFSSALLSSSMHSVAKGARKESIDVPRPLILRKAIRPSSYQDTSGSRPSLPPRPQDSFTGSSQYSSEMHDWGDHEFSEPELDLSLGQEKAGGGFGGNKAKLGKLIVYGNQGLAMLDLLISANMGVWFNDLLEA